MLRWGGGLHAKRISYRINAAVEYLEAFMHRLGDREREAKEVFDSFVKTLERAFARRECTFPPSSDVT